MSEGMLFALVLGFMIGATIASMFWGARFDELKDQYKDLLTKTAEAFQPVTGWVPREVEAMVQLNRAAETLIMDLRRILPKYQLSTNDRLGIDDRIKRLELRSKIWRGITHDD